MAGKDRRANGSAPDDAEFEKLLDEMDELGRQADALRAKVNHLIDEMRENDVPADEEADGVLAGEEAVDAGDVSAREESGDVAGEQEKPDDIPAVEGEEGNEDGDGDVAVDTDNAEGKAGEKALDEQADHIGSETS